MLRCGFAYVSKPAIFVGFCAVREPSPKTQKSHLNFKGLRRPFATAPSLRNCQQECNHMAGDGGIVSGMAGRYATALFELALEAKSLDAVKADLDRFDALVGESPDLMRLVRSPVFGSDEQLKAVTAVLDKAGIGGLAGNFIKLAAQNRRLFAVRDMIKAFRALVARHRGEISATVTVAETLNEQHLAALKDALKAVTGGKEVDLAVKVDPSIIGGLIVKLGSRMVDTSLRAKLNSIKHAMKEVS
jgi:F-type H+-transporting ATPase subunit delta